MPLPSRPLRPAGRTPAPPPKRILNYQPKIRVLEQTATIMAQSLKDYIFMVYGPPGVGKTTFINEIYDRVLFVSTDRGTRTQVASRMEAFTYEDFMDVLHTLETQRDQYQYDAVCIDHVDDMAQMFEAYICKQLGVDSLGDAAGGFGKGYKLFRDAINDFVRRLLRLDYGVCFIAHEEVKNVKVRNVEMQRTMPAMSKSAWKVIVPLADFIGYAGLRTVKNDQTGRLEDIRILETIPRQDLDAKDRTRRNKPDPGTYEYLDGKAFSDTFPVYVDQPGAPNNAPSATSSQSSVNPSRNPSATRPAPGQNGAGRRGQTPVVVARQASSQSGRHAQAAGSSARTSESGRPFLNPDGTTRRQAGRPAPAPSRPAAAHAAGPGLRRPAGPAGRRGAR